MQNRITQLWKSLYKDKHLSELTALLKETEAKIPEPVTPKSGPVYRLNPYELEGGFRGIREKIPYFKELKIATLWLTPIQESPNRYHGFDISHFEQPAFALGQERGLKLLEEALTSAEIQLIIDIPLNGTSKEHPWFIDARTSRKSPYRNRFFWTENPSQLKPVKRDHWPLPEDIWEKNLSTNDYFLTSRNREIVDLNWHNPLVCLDMLKGIYSLTSPLVAAVNLLWVEDIWKSRQVINLIKAFLTHSGRNVEIITRKNLPRHTQRALLWPFREDQPFKPEKWQKQLVQSLKKQRRTSRGLPSFPFAQDWVNTLPGLPQQGNRSLWDLSEDRPEIRPLIMALLLAFPGNPLLLGGNEIGRSRQWGTFSEDLIRKGRFDRSFPPHQLFLKMASLLEDYQEYRDFWQEPIRIRRKGTLLILTRKGEKEKIQQIFNISHKGAHLGETEIPPWGYATKLLK